MKRRTELDPHKDCEMYDEKQQMHMLKGVR